ncbi:MAG: DUF481 domain-containing protein, partial [Kiritimatiellae bacterium]|nr:DUF481 domain-containing protein [Kiritimatiellia bacterium]
AVAIGGALAAEDPVAARGGEWENKIALGASLSSGNADSAGATGRVVLEKPFGRTLSRLALDGGYEERRLRESETGRRYDERTAGNAKFSANLKRRFEGWYAFTAGSGLHDSMADVRYRFMETGGVGTFLAYGPGLRFSVEAGPAFIQEALGGAGGDAFSGVRAAQRLDWKPEESGFKLWQSVEGIADGEDRGRALLSAEIGVEAPLSGGFSLVVKAGIDHDTDPADGAEGTDSKLGAMLALSF